MLGDDRLLAHVIKQKATRSIRILRHTRRKAFLPNQRRRLVPQTPHDRNLRESTRGNRAVRAGIRRRDNSRKMNLALDAKEIQQGIIVPQRFQIHEHRPRSVCRIRDKDVGSDATVQTVYEPRVYGAKRQRAPIECLLHPRDMRQHPEQLGRGRVGRQRETAEAVELGCPWFLLEVGYDPLGARVCPDYGIVEGFAGLVVPDDCCFALVCDSDAFDAVARVAVVLEFADGCLDACFHGGDEFEGVVLVPAGGIGR